MKAEPDRLQAAAAVLEGLSVGDALGEALGYQHYRARARQDCSAMRPGQLRYTDDAEMAIAIVECLAQFGAIEEDALAALFAHRFEKDPERGYGKMARMQLQQIAAGSSWREISPAAFGKGSFGNGSAMRVAPIGAYFHDDWQRIVEMAAASARVTHFHPEGIAGAVAVAVATAAAWNARGLVYTEAAKQVWNAVIRNTPPGEVADRLRTARLLPADTSVSAAAQELGCGYEVSCQDTVPFCIWNACRSLNDYRESLISAIEVGGDCDTTCAIIGAIVCAYCSVDAIPGDWLAARERLPKIDCGR